MLIFGISSESAAHDTSSALQTDKLSAFMCQAPKLETSGLDSLETSGLGSLETSGLDSLETSGLDGLETSGRDRLEATGAKLSWQLKAEDVLKVNCLFKKFTHFE